MHPIPLFLGSTPSTDSGARHSIDLPDQKIRDCFERGKILGHDTLMIKVESPFIEQNHDNSGLSVKLRLCLFCGPQMTDERIVTVPTRRHQFLVPMFDALTQSRVSLEIEPIELAGCDIVPDFSVEIESCVRRDLVVALEEKMVWIFSSPRSGSTWIASDILGRLPSRSRSADNTGTRPIDEMGLGRILGTFECEPEYFYRIDNVVAHCDSGPDFDTVAGKRTISDRPLFERTLFKDYNRPESMLGDATRSTVREMIRRVTFDHVLMHWGVLDFDRVVFKAQNEGHAADLIMDALPRARMIFLMRDGRDVLRSRFSPFASRILAETEDTGLRRTAVAYYAHQWNWYTDIIRRAYDSHHPDRRLLLTYEELRRESEQASLLLMNFVGAAMEPVQISKLMADVRLENFPEAERGPRLPRQQGKIGGYKSAFTSDEKWLMTTIMADNLRRYGYDVSLPALPTINDRFAEVTDRLPDDILLYVANGLYDDFWVSDRVLLTFSLPYSIRGLSVTIAIPPEFLSLHPAWTVTLYGKNSVQAKTVIHHDAVTLTMSYGAEKDELITIELFSDMFICPKEVMDSTDERRVSFCIFKIDVEKV